MVQTAPDDQRPDPVEWQRGMPNNQRQRSLSALLQATLPWSGFLKPGLQRRSLIKPWTTLEGPSRSAALATRPSTGQWDASAVDGSPRDASAPDVTETATMTFATSDRQFGVVLTPCPGQGRWQHSFFVFQLIINDQVIGDAEPCLPYSAMRQLRQLPELDADRLPDVLREPHRALELLLTVEDLHDRAVLGGAESLDRWFACLYRQGPTVVALAQAHQGTELAGPILVAVITRAAYDAVVDAAWRFFLERTGHPDPGRP